MSERYAESNKESTIDLYNKRIIYQGAVITSNAAGYKNLVNFNFGEKHLYGRVNRFFVPIVPSHTLLPLKNFKATNAAEKSISAINFVVDAFSGLALEFKRCAASGQISSNDPYLSNLTVYKAYEDPKRLHDEHLTTYFNSITNEFRRRKVQVKNFDEFIAEFELLLESSIREIPFTKSAYVKSRYCPTNCSGLVVEIADLNCANDEEKINNFINSPNWEFYVNACRSYGFMVDRFIPWRLVADIGTDPVPSPMLDYAAKYGAGTTDQILAHGFERAHVSFYNKFKYFLLNLYNKVKPTGIQEIRHCSGVPKIFITYPQIYTIDQLTKKYSEEYFLKLYFDLRFLEEESQFKDFEKEMLIDDCLELYQHKSEWVALETFERILNKTFDYQGSLSYIKEQLEAERTTTATSAITTTGGGY